MYARPTVYVYTFDFNMHLMFYNPAAAVLFIQRAYRLGNKHRHVSYYTFYNGCIHVRLNIIWNIVSI